LGESPECTPLTGGDLLGNEDDLFFLPALGVPENQPLILHILDPELEDFSNPKASPGHEFQQKTVSDRGDLEDDLVHGLLFRDLPRSVLGCPEQLSQQDGVTGIPELRIKGIADEREERTEDCVAAPLGCLSPA